MTRSLLLFGSLLVLVGVVSFQRDEARAVGALTSPIPPPLGTTVNSWFDHDSPGLTSSASLPFTRFDGYQDNTTNALCTGASSCYCTAGLNCYNGHGGIDFSTNDGANGGYGYPIVASAPGTVQEDGFSSSFGYYVRIWHSPGNYSTLYGHMSQSTPVQPGWYVGRGTIVGYSDCTGTCFGAHLHFGVYDAQIGGNPIDPYGWAGGGADPWTPDNAFGYMWIANPPQWAPGYTNFQSWLLQTGTPQGRTNSSQWTYAMGDWNRDGAPDLVGIKMNGTPNDKTELHILSGGSNFQTWLLHIATPLEATNSDFWAFAMGDWNRDGTPDLIVIKKQGATSTEVHILSGAQNFTTWLLHTSTPLEKTSYNWRFEAGDFNRDGTPDLYGIRTYSTGTHTVEVFVLSGASNFGSSLLSTGTPLAELFSGTWSFAVGDWTLDSGPSPDLWFIKQNQTPSSTEVHILAGETNFQTWALDTTTPLQQTDTSWQFDASDYNHDQIPDLNIIRLQGTSSTEMHILRG